MSDTPEQPIRYLTYSELIFVNGRILGDTELQAGTVKPRDIDLVLASEQRPQASAFGADAYPTLREKAAVLLHAIARSHPFKDGNKRTSTVCAMLFCRVNGVQVVWEQEDALSRILDVAEGRTDWQTFAEWLPIKAQSETFPEPNIDQDTALIDAIILEQKWLLDELDKR